MKPQDYLIFAFESVILNKFRSLLSILGIAIGVAAVIAGVILGIGNRQMIMEKLAENGTDISWFYSMPKAKNKPFLEQLSYEPDLSITKSDVQYIKSQCSAVKEVVPFLFMPALLHYKGKYYTIKSIGFMLPASAKSLFRIETIEGRFLSEVDFETRARTCVVEKSKFSDEIFGREDPLGKKILIWGEEYKIIGVVNPLIFSFGYPERLIMLFPATSLQDSVGTKKYSSVWVRARSVEEVAKVRYQLKQAILQRFGYPSKYIISEYGSYLKTALEILDLLTFIIVGIAVISLTVGGVGIMNVMMTTVTEKTREIGIAKAIGAQKRTILLLFLVEAVILAGIGGILGILFGIGASKLVTMLAGIPLIIPYWVIFLAFSLSFMVGIISGSYPAKRAAELSPVEALRQL